MENVCQAFKTVGGTVQLLCTLGLGKVSLHCTGWFLATLVALHFTPVSE